MIEEQIRTLIDSLRTELFQTERVVSQQMITLATFVVTAIAAFVAVPGSGINNLGIAEKIFILVDVMFLLLSAGCGLIHLLITRNMWDRGLKNAKLAEKVLNHTQSLSPDDKETIGNSVLVSGGSFTQAFFYLQISLLAAGMLVFVGLIISLLF